eukprot:362270-Chlamydomonas_euryale.AAC.2
MLARCQLRLGLVVRGLVGVGSTTMGSGWQGAGWCWQHHYEVGGLPPVSEPNLSHPRCLWNSVWGAGGAANKGCERPFENPFRDIFMQSGVKNTISRRCC